MRYFIYSFLVFNFLVFNLPTSTAQDSLKVSTEAYNPENPPLEWSNKKRSRHRAYLYAKELNEGSLVVVLKTNAKRLKELGILSRKPELSEVQRGVIKDKIKKTQAETKLINDGLISGFSMAYSFSNVYFMYDTNLTQLSDGSTKGIFVDETGAIDKTIEMMEENYYICNYVLVSASNNTEGLVIFDSESNRVKQPFPGVAVASSSGLNSLFQLLINNDKYQKKAILRDIQKLGNSLEVFLNKGNREFRKP